MTGINIGGVGATPPPSHPPFPYMAFEDVSTNAIWMIGDLMTPVRLSTTAAGTLYDPMLSPIDPDEFVYAAINGGNAQIYTVDMNNDTKNDFKTITTSTQNPFPYYFPNGTAIVYLEVNGANYDIRTINTDGTGDTSLYTTSTRTITCPCVSPSGDYIAFGQGDGSNVDQLWIMNSDGSSPAAVANAAGDATGLQWVTPYTYMSWANNSDVLGWMEMSDSIGGSNASVWKKVNGDGTGLTTLLTVANAVPSPITKWQGSGRFCWLPDDSAMVGFSLDGSSDPRWRLTKVDAAGGGETDLGTNFRYGTFGSNAYGAWRCAAQVFQGPSADGRIYWSQDNVSGDPADYTVVSVLPDGTDLRTDDDGTESPAHGYFSFIGRAN